MNYEIFKTIAATCNAHSAGLLAFPTWYEYLPCAPDPITHKLAPQLLGINDVWLIAAAIIEIFLRIAAVLAVVFVIYGGVQYLTSQGAPERTDQARKTILSAVIGLAIAISAGVVIAFIAKKLGA